MKNFWRKVNRGLLLGALLIAILVGFVVVKEVQFRTETSQIRERAVETIEAMLNLNLSREETELGQPRSGEVRAREMARMESMLGTYWDADTEGGYFTNVETVRAAFEEYLASPVQARFYELDLSISEREIAVRQNGTDYAVVTVEFDNLSARYLGNGESLFYGAYSGGGNGGILPLEYVGAYYGYVEMELHRKNGEWRTCGMSVTLYMTNKTVADGATEGEK